MILHLVIVRNLERTNTFWDLTWLLKFYGKFDAGSKLWRWLKFNHWRISDHGHSDKHVVEVGEDVLLDGDDGGEEVSEEEEDETAHSHNHVHAHIHANIHAPQKTTRLPNITSPTSIIWKKGELQLEVHNTFRNLQNRKRTYVIWHLTMLSSDFRNLKFPNSFLKTELN